MGDRLTGEYYPSLIIGFLCLGMAAVCLLIGRPARTTTWMCVTLAGMGMSAGSAGFLADNVPADDLPLWMRLYGVPLTVLTIGSAMYIRAVSDTNPVESRSRSLALFTTPVGIVLSLTSLVTCALFPRELFNDGAFSLFEPDHGGAFYAILGYMIAAGVVFTAGWVALARQGVDPEERDRALLTGAAVPFISAALLLPYKWSIASLVMAFLFPLAGLLRYMTVSGARGVFLAKFLSPEVLDVVRHEGILGISKPQSLSVSAVYCDLRGFTAYAEAVPSQAVIGLLAEYYDALGQVAGDAHATIKDYAGDGVLILVGAPIARPDHAESAIAVAHAVLDACSGVLERWSTGPHPLGLGIGVASGRVTVGAIGSIDRMEYTAVGIPVNLSARLCSVAASGEILVDQRTADLCPGNGLAPRDPVTLKGLSGSQSVFALAP